MGRDHTFFDKEFRGSNYDPNDDGTFTRNLVFVAMAFTGEEMDNVYKAIKDECSKLNLNSNRVDENVGSGLIIREITNLIESAEFIIIDLTHERPNVYYELGYAHGVGNESNDVLLIAKEGTKIHFDIAPMRVHFYRNTEQLREIVSEKLKGMIRKTRRL